MDSYVRFLGALKHLFWSSRQNLKLCRDIMSHGQNSLSFFSPTHLFHLYEALAFRARGEVLSSDFTTPLVAPPETSESDLTHKSQRMQKQCESKEQHGITWCPEAGALENSPLVGSLLWGLLFGLTVFFFEAWFWLCSLHFFSWKLMNFHIIQACVRQIAARQVILRRRGIKLNFFFFFTFWCYR